MDEKQKEICESMKKLIETPTSTNGAHPPAPKKGGWKIPNWTKNIWRSLVLAFFTEVWNILGLPGKVVLRFSRSLRIRTKYIWRRQAKPALARILNQFAKSVRIQTKYVWRRRVKPRIERLKKRLRNWLREKRATLRRQLKARWPIVVWALVSLAVATYVVRSLTSSYESSIEQVLWLIAIIAASVLVAWLVFKFYKRSRKTTKEKPTRQPQASAPRVSTTQGRGWVGAMVGALATLLLIFVIWKGVRLPINTPQASANTAQPVFSATILGLPADVVLPIIAECESGGRQFDSEGNLVVNETSMAVGKYQILTSLHEEQAKSLGFDIKTLEGNEAYARHLFNESRTRAWEADPRSKACWEPKLFEKAGLPASAQRVTVTAQKEWSEEVSLPPGRLVDWTPRSAVTYEMMTADGKITVFPAVTQSAIKVPTLAPWFKVRAVDADSVGIDFVHYVPKG